MRGKSHYMLGQYLVQHYMRNVSQLNVQSFLFGCIEPDRNPATYLKGSLRYQWLRGHNYRNARQYMKRISSRLERKEAWNLFDYYTLGKLIHYTADAFTLAHNDWFSTSLGDHRIYEAELQEHFLNYLQEDPQVNPLHAKTIMQTIYSYHKAYQEEPSSIRTDSHFVLTACCCILAIRFMKP